MSIFENDEAYAQGFGAGYAQAIGDADTALRTVGDDQTIRYCRKAILALVNVSFDPDEARPRPDWTSYRVPSVRYYPQAAS